MKKNKILYIVLTVLAVLALVSIAADDSGRKIIVTMIGANERPGPGDPDGSGTAEIMLNLGQSRVCWELTVSDIAPATAAHIHVAPVTSPGPVVIPLSPPTSGTSNGCAEVSRELIKAIMHNPENYYVNVHNAEYPGGAIRAQLSK